MYRPIRRDMGEGITPSIDFGPVTQMRWIEIDQLCVDDSYQREIGKRGRNNIKRIAENFEWFKFAPVIVAPLVDDRYAIVDGQHRTTAAAICGIATVPCQIIIADQAKQAEAFAAVNGSITKTTPHQVFHARVAARDPLIAEIEKACQVASVFITRTQKGAAHYKVGETAAIGAITKAYLRYGRETLITGLMCITQTGDGNVGYIRSTIVEAMCAALAHRRDWRDAGDALLRAMDEFIFAEEWDRASEGRTNIIKSKAVSKIFYDRIVEHLSTRLKTSIQASYREPTAVGLPLAA